jgi:hypothetical protein
VIIERIWKLIDKSGPVPNHRTDLGPCWMWMGAKVHGYGVTKIKRKMRYVFHLLYAELHPELPEGMERDHLCRNPGCVNPSHVEAVTARENTLRGVSPPAANARKTHCPKGHPLSEGNLTPYALRQGSRQCWICAKEHDRTRPKRKVRAR